MEETLGAARCAERAPNYRGEEVCGKDWTLDRRPAGLKRAERIKVAFIFERNGVCRWFAGGLSPPRIYVTVSMMMCIISGAVR